MTSYIRKMPAAVAVLFFSVAAFVAIYKGAGILTALYRGCIAAAVSAVFAALLAYILFKEEIPEPEAPEELKDIAEKFKRGK